MSVVMVNSYLYVVFQMKEKIQTPENICNEMTPNNQCLAAISIVVLFDRSCNYFLVGL